LESSPPGDFRVILVPMTRRFSPDEIREAPYGPAPHVIWLTLTTLGAMAVPMAIAFVFMAYFASLVPSDTERRVAEARLTEVVRLAREEYRRTGQAPESLLDVPGVPPEYYAEDADVVRIVPEFRVQSGSIELTAEFPKYPGYSMYVYIAWDNANHHLHFIRSYKR